MEWLKQLIEAALKEQLADATKLDGVVSGLLDMAKKELGIRFVPKEDFNNKNQELKDTKAKMDDLQKKIEELSKSGEAVEKIKAELDKTKLDFETFKKDADKREESRKKIAAIERGLREAKAAEDAIDLLVSQFDTEKITLDSKGNIVDWDNHLNPIKETRKTLFGESRFSGDDPNKNKNGGKPSVNPWKKEHFNLTKQGEIIRDDPELAKTLMKEAGKIL